MSTTARPLDAVCVRWQSCRARLPKHRFVNRSGGLTHGCALRRGIIVDASTYSFYQ